MRQAAALLRRWISRWVTGPMLLSFALFGTLPAWIEPIGLYQYLGVEIIVWVIFALAVNLLLGYTGLDLHRKSGEHQLKQEVFDGTRDQVYGGVQARGGAPGSDQWPATG